NEPPTRRQYNEPLTLRQYKKNEPPTRRQYTTPMRTEPPPAKKLSKVLEEIERSAQRGEPPPVNDHDRRLPGNAVPDSPLSERLEKANSVQSDKNTEGPQTLVGFTDSDKDRRSIKLMTASKEEVTLTGISSSELKARRGWRELPPTLAQGAPGLLITA